MSDSDDQVLTHFCGAFPLVRTRGVARSAQMWAPGQLLRVCFLGGSPALQRRTMQTAKQWEQFANISLVQVQAMSAEIRVGFDPRGGAWSYVGRDCIRPDLFERPTMNLGWLSEHTGEVEFRRVVLHEFGHALGLEHEHRSPDAAIQWNVEAVLAYYRRTQGWTDDYIRHNVLEKIRGHAISTRFDDRSIMLYPIPAALTHDGHGIPWENSTLSDGDKRFITQLYPRSGGQG